ncbi:phage tail protein [Agarilytica rhodophyticola]|uniref:phage tail protein n=1 Tax=Agarilytica rhodophyticola TaxID=1737490 RepID=UPI000B342A59|nr:phage tail protein [Agarilytica rhodophyticola]
MFIDSGLPLVGYRFVVVIFSAGIPNPVDMQFREVSGLKMARGISRNATMTTLDNQLPTQTLTLKRGVFTSPSPLMIANVVESFFWDTRLLRKDIMINVLSENDIPVNAWLVTNAYLESWDWDGLNASSSDVLVESMSFKYSGIKYIPLKFVKTGSS